MGALLAPRPVVACASCAAVCCRLIVQVGPDEAVPAELLTRNAQGLLVLARGRDGWCRALDRTTMRCAIYANRPEVCRRFVVAGPYCRAVRDDHAQQVADGIPLTVY